jgi:Tfp pilus assembly protein FimT
MAILAAIAIPRAGSLLDGIHVQGAATELESLFHTARQSAILRSANATLGIDTISGVITISVGNDTIKRREVGTIHGVQLSATRTSSTYSPVGLGYGAANLTLVVSRGVKAETLTVSRLGRVKR